MQLCLLDKNEEKKQNKVGEMCFCFPSIGKWQNVLHPISPTYTKSLEKIMDDCVGLFFLELLLTHNLSDFSFSCLWNLFIKAQSHWDWFSFTLFAVSFSNFHWINYANSNGISFVHTSKIVFLHCRSKFP